MSAGFWRVVTLVTVWHIAASVCYYAVYAGTPLFRDAFELSGLEIGLVVTALTLGYAVFLLPFGVATDRFGEHRTLTGGLAGLALGVLAVAAAPTYPWLLVAAFLLGSMYGSATPGTNKAIFDRIEPDRQHRAIGIKQVGPTVGSAVGAVLVTGLAGAVLWQSGFLVAATVGLVTAVGFFLVYREAEGVEASYPDFLGLLSNRTYVVLLPAGVCLGGAFYTTTGYAVLFVEESVGATVATGGLVLAALQVASSAGADGFRTRRAGCRGRDPVPGAPADRDHPRGECGVRRPRPVRPRLDRALLLLYLDGRRRRGARGGLGRGTAGRDRQRPVRPADVRIPRRRERVPGRLGIPGRPVVRRCRTRFAGGPRRRLILVPRLVGFREFRPATANRVPRGGRRTSRDEYDGASLAILMGRGFDPPDTDGTSVE